jgi:hypothetical protein
MNTYPDSDSQRAELKRLAAEPWMVELLKLNPAYTGWAPGDDCMLAADQHGWTGGLSYPLWALFDVVLDDLNECIHFHFEIMRAEKRCPTCDGCGYNPETRVIYEDFYGHERSGSRWCCAITPGEASVLRAEHRVGGGWSREKQEWMPDERSDEQLARDCNEAQRTGFMHDGCNHHILTKARATRLGVYGLCPQCEGHGSVFVEPKAHLGLVLWIIHPRKGASRGVEIKRINQSDLPSVFSWLAEAARRNAARFEKVVAAAKGGKGQ